MAHKRRYQKIAELKAQGSIEAPLLSEKKVFDPDAKTDELLRDLRNLQEKNPEKYITRRFYREHGTYSDSTWDCKFGTFHEFRRQAGLELSRGQQKLEKQIAKHASEDVHRGFYEAEVLPWLGRYAKEHGSKRWQTALIGSDFHDKDTDPFALNVFLETAARVQPDIVCLAGDVFDLYDFSRFDKDPRQSNLVEAFRYVKDNIFSPLRASCPNTQIDFLIGNHEHRLLRHFAERTPYLKVLLSDLMGLSLADMFGIREHQINLISKNDLWAYKAVDIRKQAGRNYATYWDNLLVVDHYGDRAFGTYQVSGHTHRPGFKGGANVNGPHWWWCNGAMARTDTEYWGRLAQASNSFCMVHCDTVNRQCLLEPILFSDYSCMVGGIRYDRNV